MKRWQRSQRRQFATIAAIATIAPIANKMAERKPYSLFIGIIFTLLLLLFLYSVADVLLLFFIAILFAVYLALLFDP